VSNSIVAHANTVYTYMYTIREVDHTHNNYFGQQSDKPGVVCGSRKARSMEVAIGANLLLV
jgi:hypothetical protein